MKELTQSGDYSDVLSHMENGFATLVLNRPAALNALDYDMIVYIRDVLNDYDQKDDVGLVCFKGAGERSFCAGGDIKALYYLGQENRDVADLYFYEEYRLNRLIKNYKKPVLSYMDGIVMGGGYGVGGPSRYRIVTDRTVFAMPEVNIGLFPDVGSMFSLTRCPGKTGLYLALTGYQIKADDMLYCGLADYYVPCGAWEDCQRRLMALPASKTDELHDDVALILKSCHVPPEGTSVLEKHRELIDRCFAADTVLEILERLESAKEQWAAETAAHIRSRCPKSVAVTFEHYRRACHQDFDTVTATDFTLVQSVLRDTELYEGIRALLIDKDKTPRWNPDKLESVTDDMVSSYFSFTGKRLDCDRNAE